MKLQHRVVGVLDHDAIKRTRVVDSAQALEPNLVATSQRDFGQGRRLEEKTSGSEWEAKVSDHRKGNAGSGQGQNDGFQRRVAWGQSTLGDPKQWLAGAQRMMMIYYCCWSYE